MIARLLFIVGSLAFAGACSPPAASNPAGSGKSETKRFDAAGGSLTLEAVTLTVPPNALGGVSVSVTSSPNPAAANYTAFTPVFVFEPVGTTLGVPATVEFDLGAAQAKEPVVYWTRPGTSVFERQPTTVSGAKVSARVSHLGSGFVAEAPKGGAGDGGVTGSDAFLVLDLDPSAREQTYLAMAVAPSTGNIGVAYFTPRNTTTQSIRTDAGMEGVPDYDLKYVEVVNGVVSAPETIRFVQRRVGLALAFDPMGRPVVSYLGGAQGFEPGMSIFWFQSDSVVNRRLGPNQWVETVVTRNGADVTCGNPVSDTGFLVGLFPALAFDSTGKLYLAYRDTHNGQYPQQDWAGSDVEVVEDVLGSRRLVCAQPGGNDKQAWGGRIRMIIGAADQPAVVYDKALGGADTRGNDVVFQRRQASGAWTAPALVANISDTMTGASLAWHPDEGWAFAVTDGTTNKLLYRRNPDVAAEPSRWQQAEEVFASGTGGWYPSLALDPAFAGEPSIAYYVCSRRDQVAASACTQDQDELRVARRSAGVWRETLIDRGGGYAPQLAFLPNGKRVIAYRVPAALTAGNQVEPTAGAVKLAIER
ncbi:MAG: hypothetical protein INH41_07445 [Myxococcaceae bacterium]|jgi:hypothetical protein|nr:hypothetical protein [Myxococcaceae bacterium]MCA3012219.1 hypothetical protein [Myxococcaceae bacterium]